jgi:hypothetical protein
LSRADRTQLRAQACADFFDGQPLTERAAAAITRSLKVLCTPTA